MNVSVAEIQQALAQLYRVERELGAGGMATVYLAYDPKHDRRVAIKVLRPELAAIVGGERFLKEIRTTANLQHPHILPLHDSGEADGFVYYVMPYVEGESLRQRLKRETQLPVEDAVRITREVASGLDYAHRHGVVHRDIKPENILLHDGQALVADFGIALAVSRTDGSTRMTETGMSLGTPHYMSPEQAMGEREITPKSDVYALGCVLYEMLAGEPPFTGPTPQAIIARVVTDEPRPLTIQRRTVPLSVEAAVMTALSKLPADRFASAADFADALALRTGPTTATRSAAVLPQPTVSHSRRSATLGVVAIVLVVAASAITRLVSGSGPSAAPVARLVIQLPAGTRLGDVGIGSVVAMSPDGSSIVFSGAGRQGGQLFTRRLADLAVTPLAGSDGGLSPIFSGDGKWVSFDAGGRGVYRKLPANGGAPVPVNLPPGVTSPLWLDGDEVLVTGERGALGVVRNGVFELIARPDSTAGELALIPADVLPDGRFLVTAPSQGLNGSVWVIARNGKRSLVTRALAGAAAYSDGHVAWLLPTGALVAAPWNEGVGEISGAAAVIAENIQVAAGQPPQVAFSRTGSLVYAPSKPADLVRVDRAGRAEVIGLQPRRFHCPRVSPDGTRIAVDVTDEQRDVWLLHLRDKTFSRLTFENDGHDAEWLPNGLSVLYASARANTVGIHRRRIDGSGASDSVLHDGIAISAHAVTPDGRSAIAARANAAGGFDLVRVDLGAERRSKAIVATQFNEQFPALSPDGKWFAYTSNESGRDEVYLRPLDDAAGRIIVSRNGGTEPVWSRDGRELFYRDFEGPSIVAAAVSIRPELRILSRTRLFDASDFQTTSPHANYDVTPDGKFVFVRSVRATELIYVQNWPELVRRRGAVR